MRWCRHWTSNAALWGMLLGLTFARAATAQKVPEWVPISDGTLAQVAGDDKKSAPFQRQTVSCGSNRGEDALVLSVTAAAPLPRTGSSSTLPMTQAAVAALALGGVALGGAKVRRQAVKGRSL